MNMKNKKVKIFSGTDILMCTPSHPLAIVMQTKRIIDRIILSSDTEFEFNCNSVEGINVWEKYAHKMNGLKVAYFINGKLSNYKNVIDDLQDRTNKYVESFIKTNHGHN